MADNSFTIDTTGDPRDRISQREFDMLQEIKENPIASDLSDKAILSFMFSLKMDSKKVLSTIEENKKLRKEMGCESVKRSDVNPSLLNSGIKKIRVGDKALTTKKYFQVTIALFLEREQKKDVRSSILHQQKVSYTTLECIRKLGKKK